MNAWRSRSSLKKSTRVPNAFGIHYKKEEIEYRSIRDTAENKGCPVSLLCEILSISRSGYYKWLGKPEPQGPSQEDWLSAKILEYYTKFKGIYGVRRLTTEINKDFGYNFNVKWIRRLMRRMGLQSVIRRKRKNYIKSTPQITAENLLNRDFKAEKPNQKWLTDVTEFKYGQGSKAYLSAIFDLGDNSIVSYVLGHHNNNDLVFRTFMLAVDKQFLVIVNRVMVYYYNYELSNANTLGIALNSLSREFEEFQFIN